MTVSVDAEGFAEWVASVRRKFALDETVVRTSEYWRGYEACLADVERRVSHVARRRLEPPTIHDSDIP